MSPLSFPFSLLLIVLLLAILSPLSQAHSQIEEACKKYNTISTSSTNACVTILNALPGYTADDPKKIALLGMEYADQKVSETVETIKSKLKDKSLKARYYGALRKCIGLYNEGSYSFEFGLLAFKEENYESANYRWLKGANYDLSQCERELNMVGIKGDDLGIKTEFMLEASNVAQVAFNYFANHKVHVINKN